MHAAMFQIILLSRLGQQYWQWARNGWEIGLWDGISLGGYLKSKQQHKIKHSQWNSQDTGIWINCKLSIQEHACEHWYYMVKLTVWVSAHLSGPTLDRLDKTSPWWKTCEQTRVCLEHVAHRRQQRVHHIGCDNLERQWQTAEYHETKLETHHYIIETQEIRWRSKRNHDRSDKEEVQTNNPIAKHTYLQRHMIVFERRWVWPSLRSCARHPAWAGSAASWAKCGLACLQSPKVQTANIFPHFFRRQHRIIYSDLFMRVRSGQPCLIQELYWWLRNWSQCGWMWWHLTVVIPDAAWNTELRNFVVVFGVGQHLFFEVHIQSKLRKTVK